MALPKSLADLAERSAAPDTVRAVLDRLAEDRPGELARLATGRSTTALATVLVRVVAASNALARVCVTDAQALNVLDALDDPVALDATDPGALARSKRLELLRIAGRDLLGRDDLEAVGAALATLATGVLEGALILGGGGQLAVVGMGKLGAEELNYASDVDVLFVTEEEPLEDAARRVLQVARGCFRIDANLRPEGRAGPLTRPLDGYRRYWERWAATWEFQALLKARAVAGPRDLGTAFEEAAAAAVWGRNFSADELASVRAMKARTEGMVTRRGLAGREIKRGPGGIRDVEFAVQLLQLVHGRLDPEIRVRSTLGALAELAEAGYVAGGDASALARCYRFLRTVEHRLQLVEEEQTHAVPDEPGARRRLALVLGFADDATAPATQRFDEALRQCQAEVRAIHERLFFRPLLEAFAAVEAPPEERPAPSGMSPEAVARRLAAFGFADAARTRAAVEELAGGLTRTSRLMTQLLPLLLDWLSLSPDPDLGLLGLRNLTARPHHRALVLATFRESPEAARRLCLLLGSSRILAEALERNPSLVATIDDDALVPTPPALLVSEAAGRWRRTEDAGRRRAQLVRIRQEQQVRIAARDLLDLDEVEATGAALAGLGEALLQAALDALGPPMPFTVVGMGRLGGAEMAYASDLDVLFVFDDAGDAAGEAVAEEMLRFLHGPSPALRVATVDLGLRPEGGQGRLARDLSGYAAYFGRWAQTWERQALVRARPVAGDADLGRRFMELAEAFVWDKPFDAEDVAAVRRVKARMERERISSREDPQFHLKLGRGSLSDVEWTVQLLQLRHGVRGTGTMAALETLRRDGILPDADAEALRAAYRYCERTRNRWHLVGALPGGASPGDALPARAHELSRLARSLGTTPSALRDEYRRVTRRARRVVERDFYGIEDA